MHGRPVAALLQGGKGSTPAHPHARRHTGPDDVVALVVSLFDSSCVSYSDHETV